MSSLKFGTSGLRGLVTELEGAPSFDYTRAFLRYLASTNPSAVRCEFLLGRDLRASSPRIAKACKEAGTTEGWTVVDCGALPTPALALEAMTRGAPAIMITGSHIPDDRNGLKFYTAEGEITKAHEAGILAAYDGLDAAPQRLPEYPTGSSKSADGAIANYRRRYRDAFGARYLAGLTVGVYQHSTVARDVLADVLADLGARVLPFARSDKFIPVDTEAHRDEDRHLLAAWAETQKVDAIVSADGDGDRPLIADAAGKILRGDIAGLLTALSLKVDTIVTPITSSSAIERAVAPARVVRTKVGSPFVIAGMDAAAAEPGGVIGFEANGGVLLGSDVATAGGHLPALPTRDAILPIVCVLGETRLQATPLAQLVERMNAGCTAGNRLQNIDGAKSASFLDRLGSDPDFAREYFSDVGRIIAVDRLDGVRASLEGQNIVHYRASGNAPELRCYIEAPGEDEADALLRWGLNKVAGFVSAEAPLISDVRRPILREERAAGSIGT